VVWKHIAAVSSKTATVFPNLNLLGDGASAACLVAVDRWNELYWRSSDTVNLHAVSMHWDIISILLNVCEEIVIQIIVQEVTSAFCKTLSRIAFAKVFCHVHYYGDIDDLAGSAFIWAL
jgi:hypothetical protein